MLENFSWNRLAACLSYFDKIISSGQAFIYDGFIFIDMPWTGCMVSLGPSHILIYDREDYERPKFKVLPPDNIQLKIINILKTYKSLDAQDKLLTLH